MYIVYRYPYRTINKLKESKRPKAVFEIRFVVQLAEINVKYVKNILMITIIIVDIRYYY